MSLPDLSQLAREWLTRHFSAPPSTMSAREQVDDLGALLRRIAAAYEAAGVERERGRVISYVRVTAARFLKAGDNDAVITAAALDILAEIVERGDHAPAADAKQTAEPARLDADKTATGKTRLLGHVTYPNDTGERMTLPDLSQLASDFLNTHKMCFVEEDVDDLTALLHRIAAAGAEKERGRLRPWLRHDAPCQSNFGNYACTCGVDPYVHNMLAPAADAKQTAEPAHGSGPVSTSRPAEATSAEPGTSPASEPSPMCTCGHPRSIHTAGCGVCSHQEQDLTRAWVWCHCKAFTSPAPELALGERCPRHGAPHVPGTAKRWEEGPPDPNGYECGCDYGKPVRDLTAPEPARCEARGGTGVFVPPTMTTLCACQVCSGTGRRGGA